MRDESDNPTTQMSGQDDTFHSGDDTFQTYMKFKLILAFG